MRVTRGVRDDSVDSGSVIFDRYRLEERIGAGGMGVVWRATDLLLDQTVALKRVSLAGVDNQQAELTRARALREARLAARLRHHRHVVATYDVRIDDGDVWLVSEYLPARSLATILREDGLLIPGRAAQIGAQVADALAAAHALGIEHRDITPGNVLITDDGTVRLTDFGISHLAGEAQLTQSGAISGTFAYLAPEVARTGKSSPASDVFSLGSTLYTAIEGQPPFGIADNALELLNIVRVGIIRRPTAAGDFTPLLMRLLELDPATRPDAATARDLLDAFATPINALTRAPTTPKPPRRRLRHWLGSRTLPGLGSPVAKKSRHRGAVLTVIVALLIGAGVVVETTLGRADGSGNLSVAGTPTLPSTVGPITLTGDSKAADPCALIDPAPLNRFGVPFITFGSVLPGCQARIATPRGVVRLNVNFFPPATSVANLGGHPQQLGDLTIVRKGNTQGDFLPECTNIIVLADLTQIVIQTDPGTPFSYDLCSVTEVGTASAVNKLVHDGISYRPARISGWSLASSDACAVLDRAAIGAVAGLDPDIRYPGFANWSCTWGTSAPGSSQVLLAFRLDRANVGSWGVPTTIAGRRAWLHSLTGLKNPQRCYAYVVHRPAPTATAATEMVEIGVEGPGSAKDLCASATQLATAAEAKLPTS